MSSARAWTPNTPGTPSLWFDANVNVTTVTGAVSQWASRAGAGVMAQSTAGARPAYSATGWSTSPPRPGITFTGATAYTDLHMSAFGTIGAFSVMMRVNIATRSTLQLIFQAPNAGSGFFNWYADSSNRLVFDFSSGGGGTVTGGAVTGSAKTILFASDGANGFQYINGVLDASGPTLTGPIDTLALGANQILGIQPAQGQIVECITWTSQLSASDAVAGNTYLTQKWP